MLVKPPLVHEANVNKEWTRGCVRLPATIAFLELYANVALELVSLQKSRGEAKVWKQRVPNRRKT
jgi:hypothetical protein